MKTTKILAVLCLAILFASCDDDDPIVLDPVASETISNLFAPQIGGPGPGGGSPPSGPFTLFDFETGAETTDANAWDVGFRGTSIIVNGGTSLGTADEPARTGNAAVYFLEEEAFAGVTEVDESLFAQDSASGYAIPTGGGNGWYNYDPVGNLIIPRSGVVLVFRTTEGKFAKVDITSYYQNAPDNPDSTVDAARYYTFDYVYQPNNGVTTFE